MTNLEALELLRDTPIDIRSPREDDIHSLYAEAHLKAYKALEQADKYKWHDLKKNPDDLPREEGLYRVVFEADVEQENFEYSNYYYIKELGWCDVIYEIHDELESRPTEVHYEPIDFNVYGDIIAWQYFEPFGKSED